MSEQRNDAPQGRELSLVPHTGSEHTLPTFSPSREALDALKSAVAVGLSDDEFKVFIESCRARNLNPFTRQIYAWKSDNRLTMQISIDGLRSLAERTGRYAGRIGPQWCGPDGVWRDVWLADKAPSAARVGIRRRDFDEVTWGVAVFRSYDKANATWKKYPDVMIAKVAETLALRSAFPDDAGGLYTDDELSMPPEAFVEGNFAELEATGQPGQPGQPTGGGSRQSQQQAKQPASRVVEGALAGQPGLTREMLQQRAYALGLDATEWGKLWNTTGNGRGDLAGIAARLDTLERRQQTFAALRDRARELRIDEPEFLDIVTQFTGMAQQKDLRTKLTDGRLAAIGAYLESVGRPADPPADGEGYHDDDEEVEEVEEATGAVGAHDLSQTFTEALVP